MKIILHYDDYTPTDPQAEIIIGWIKRRIMDKSVENTSLLRYVDRVEVR